MFRYGVVAAASVLLGVQTMSADQLKETLMAQKEKVVEAIKQNDAETIANLLADQQYSVTANSGRFSSADVQQETAAKNITAHQLSDAELVDVDDNVKILTFKYTWSGTFRGQSFENESVYATVVWALRDGEWKSVFYQETPVAAA